MLLLLPVSRTAIPGNQIISRNRADNIIESLHYPDYEQWMPNRLT
jgi:hypothetical protein